MAGEKEIIPNGCTYEEIESISNFLKQRTVHRPRIGIICGSGLGGLADTLEQQEIIEYKDIPDFPISTVHGHKGRLVFGILKGKPTVCMQGRFHPYEGYPLWKCTLPVRVMKLMGVEILIATNAAGGLNPNYHVGDIMVLRDHLNLLGLCGLNPLIGQNDERFGVRFPAMSGAYDKDLIKLTLEKAKCLGLADIMHRGTYIIQAGPCYETIAECRMMRTMGADVTGMSTVHEIVTAVHCGMKCLGMSLVTNECIMDYDDDRVANHAEVIETSKKRSVDMQKLVADVVEAIQITIS